MKKYGILIVKGLLYLLSALVMISALLPLWWMITTSFKSLEDSFRWPPTFLPQPATLEAYEAVIVGSNMPRYLMNSAIYAVFGALFAILFATLSGYTFAKFQFKGKKWLFALVLATMMIPSQVTLIPVFLILKEIGWYNTYLGLIVPGLGNAFGIFLIRQFALGIPDDLLEAARIDGASELHIFARIFVPLCIPIIGTEIVLEFMGRWNDLFWPLIVTNGDNLRTVQIAMKTIAVSGYVTYWNQFCAAMFLSFIPIFIIYVFFQKYFTQGIALTGTKG